MWNNANHNWSRCELTLWRRVTDDLPTELLHGKERHHQQPLACNWKHFFNPELHRTYYVIESFMNSGVRNYNTNSRWTVSLVSDQLAVASSYSGLRLFNACLALSPFLCILIGLARCVMLRTGTFYVHVSNSILYRDKSTKSAHDVEDKCRRKIADWGGGVSKNNSEWVEL